MRCVIVDDNEPFLNEARNLLGREGVEVVGVARTQAEALKEIARLRPELTLVDIDLGQESGFAVVQALVDDSRTSRSAMILISAYDESDFVDLVYASPAVGFISKTELSARAIHDVLRRHAGATTD